MIMNTKSKIFIGLQIILFVTLLALWMKSFDWQGTVGKVVPKTPQNSTEASGEGAAVSEKADVEVVDGDTIDVNGVRVRYIGVNTPEIAHTTGAKDSCFGREATEFNRSLVIGVNIRMEKDVSETDKYMRLLRYVYLPDGRMVNKILVAEGYARAATFPPDVAHATEFKNLESQAREAKKGLWGKCD